MVRLYRSGRQKARQDRWVFFSTDCHWLGVAANFNLCPRKCVVRNARALADLVGYDDLAIEGFAQILQSGGDVDRIAKRREHRMAAEADVADDGIASIDADAILDRVAHFRGELMVQMRDVRGDQRRGLQRLPASQFRGRISVQIARAPRRR